MARIYIYIHFPEFINYKFFFNCFPQNGKSSLKISWPIFTQSGHQPQKIYLADMKLRIYICIKFLYLWLQTALFYFLNNLNHFYCSLHIPRLQTTLGSSSQLEWRFSAAMFGTSTILLYLEEANKPGVDIGSVTKKKVED